MMIARSSSPAGVSGISDGAVWGAAAAGLVISGAVGAGIVAVVAGGSGMLAVGVSGAVGGVSGLVSAEVWAV